ncbi:hypothetical protein [Trueperella bialowiezensis]|uniref:DUF3592 domain-containing protein n=1 Tax=Trueperella bialowiezensis TaxID=312285 RepID=A0A3S4VB46_9ACTO|nr:hypothetical protein [Trueperella bialowiezensis]VEI13630.1 Uncharacterised protein [Trueperella bialowiezensis]
MVIWLMGRRIGIGFTALAIGAGILILVVGLALGGAGLIVGPLVGVLTTAALLTAGLPPLLISNSHIKAYRRVAANGPRITAVVDGVYEQYIHPANYIQSKRMWTVHAYGPTLHGGERPYTEIIGETMPRVRRGDHITIAVDPSNPNTFAMLIPDTAQYHGQRW